MTKFRSVAALGIIVLMSLWYTHGRVPLQTTQFPSARTQRDGDIWLAWSKLAREGFVRGYLSGYKTGHNEGCGEAIRFLVPDGTVIKGPDPDAHCESVQSLFSQSPAHYAELITTFYATYSKDREVPLPMLLWLLSDQQSKSIQQIDEWYTHGANRNLPESRN